MLENQATRPLKRALSKNKLSDTIELDSFYYNTITRQQRTLLETSANMSDLIVNFSPIVNGKVYKTLNSDRMVPLQEVCECFGYNYRFNTETGMISINEKYSLLVGKNSCSIDGDVVMLDAPPIVISGRAYVSLDFFSKVLNKCAYELNNKVLIYDL